MMSKFTESRARIYYAICWRRVSVISALLVCGLGVGPRVAVAEIVAQAEQGKKEADTASNKVSVRPNWRITPFVSADGTYTDNVNLAANKKADFITRLSPGITVHGEGGRFSGNLNYQWQRYSYAEQSARSNQQRSLAAKGKLELVEQWLFLEGSHNISQQSVSALGTQSVGNELINANRSETASYSISPYIQGRLGGVADYQLRYSGTHTRSDAGALSGAAATTRSWSGRLSGATTLSLLGWNLNADQQVVHNSNNFDTRSEHVLGGLTYHIDPQLRVQVRVGRESDNFTSVVRQSRTTSGMGVDWAPTERTSISLKKDRNAAGNAHSIDFSHRTALSAWKFSDSRSVSIPTPQMALSKTGTAYDLLYLQLASAIPDPVERAAETGQQLAQAGIAADAPIFGSLMTSQAFIQRRQQASVALIGVNNTVVFAFDRGNSERMGAGIGLADDFALNTDIRQSGFNTTWAHKLTPHAALSLNGRKSRSSGSSNLDTSLSAWSLMFTTQLGASTSGSLGWRQSRFDSSAGNGYDEQALTGAVQLKF